MRALLAKWVIDVLHPPASCSAPASNCSFLQQYAYLVHCCLLIVGPGMASCRDTHTAVHLLTGVQPAAGRAAWRQTAQARFGTYGSKGYMSCCKWLPGSKGPQGAGGREAGNTLVRWYAGTLAAVPGSGSGCRRSCLVCDRESSLARLAEMHSSTAS